MREFQILAVGLADDPRVPGVVEEVHLLVEVDRFVHGLLLA